MARQKITQKRITVNESVKKPANKNKQGKKKKEKKEMAAYPSHSFCFTWAGIAALFIDPWIFSAKRYPCSRCCRI